MIDPTTLAEALIQQKEMQDAATPLPQKGFITIKNTVDGEEVTFDSSKLDPSFHQHVALMGLLDHIDIAGQLTPDEMYDWMLATYSKEYSMQNIIMGLAVNDLLINEVPNGTPTTVYSMDLTVPSAITAKRQAYVESRNKIIVYQSGTFTCNGNIAPVCPICRSMEQREFTSQSIPYDLSLKDIEEYVPPEPVKFIAVSTCNCSEDITWEITVTPDASGGPSTVLFERVYADRISRVMRHAGAMSRLPNNR